MTAVVEIAGLRKEYAMGDDVVHALRGVDLTLKPGEFVAVMGPSGSGKSTFMHLVGLLDAPTAGTYRFEGTEVAGLRPDERAEIRGRRLGFVFQAYNLLPRTTALENVELPMVYAGVPEGERKAIGLEKLQLVGIPQLAGHHPNQMSGGQQQRVAIARSLVNDPGLILADEPTGALDTQSSQDVMRLLTRLNDAEGITVMLVTHEPEIAAYARRIVTFRDGLITSDSVNERRAA